MDWQSSRYTDDAHAKVRIKFPACELQARKHAHPSPRHSTHSFMPSLRVCTSAPIPSRTRAEHTQRSEHRTSLHPPSCEPSRHCTPIPVHLQGQPQCDSIEVHSRSSSRPTAMRFDRGRTNWHFGADSGSGKCATHYSAIASPAIASPANASPAITQLPHAHKHWSATLTPAPRGGRARQTAHPPPAWASARPHSPAGSGRRRRRPP